jgi:hypothetical protein
MCQTREKIPKHLRWIFLNARRVWSRNLCWPFIDLGHLVESEGEKDIPHFQEAGRASRKR